MLPSQIFKKYCDIVFILIILEFFFKSLTYIIKIFHIPLFCSSTSDIDIMSFSGKIAINLIFGS